MAIRINLQKVYVLNVTRLTILLKRIFIGVHYSFVYVYIRFVVIHRFLIHDVRGIIVRQGPANLDWTYIITELEPLCGVKEQPEIVDRLESLRREMKTV